MGVGVYGERAWGSMEMERGGVWRVGEGVYGEWARGVWRMGEGVYGEWASGGIW